MDAEAGVDGETARGVDAGAELVGDCVAVMTRWTLGVSPGDVVRPSGPTASLRGF